MVICAKAITHIMILPSHKERRIWSQESRIVVKYRWATEMSRSGDEVPFGGKPTFRPRWTREGGFPLSSFQSLYVVELNLSSRTRLARQTHGRRMYDP